MASGFSHSMSSFSKEHPVLHTALQFGGIGAGAAATVALIRELRDAMEERDKEKDRNKVEISPGTIVLRVPKSKLRGQGKVAEDLHEVKGEHEKVHNAELISGINVDVRKLQALREGRQRDVSGRFVSDKDVRVNPSEKKAEETGVGTRATEILAALGSAAGGYYLVDMLRQKLQQRRLKKQIAAAQQEYVDMMSGPGVKNAEFVNSVFGASCGLGKEAGIRDTWRDMWNQGKNVSAGGLATMIAIALGSGYLTKRVLENKFDEPEEEPELPKVNRILFKAYDDGEKEAGAPIEITHGQALATLDIMMGEMSHPGIGKEAADYSFLDKITSSPAGRQWILDAYASGRGLDRPGFSMNTLPGMSAMDKLKYARTLIGMKRNPDRHMPAVESRVMSIMRNDPGEWFSMLGSDNNRDLVDSLARDAIDKRMPGLPGFVKDIGTKWLTRTGSGSKRLMSEFMNSIGAGSVKESSAMPVVDMFDRMNNIAANQKTLRDKTNAELSRKLDMVLDRMDSGVKRRKGRRKSVPDAGSDVDVDMSDDAEGYVVENAGEIAKALGSLKRKGLV